MSKFKESRGSGKKYDPYKKKMCVLLVLLLGNV